MVLKSPFWHEFYPQMNEFLEVEWGIGCQVYSISMRSSLYWWYFEERQGDITAQDVCKNRQHNCGEMCHSVQCYTSFQLQGWIIILNWLEYSAICPWNDTQESIRLINKNSGKIFFFLSFSFFFFFFFFFFFTTHTRSKFAAIASYPILGSDGDGSLLSTESFDSISRLSSATAVLPQGFTLFLH